MIKVRNYAGHKFDFGDHKVVIEERDNTFASLPSEVIALLKTYDSVFIEQVPDRSVSDSVIAR